MPPNGYDYRTSSVDEDWRRAKEVYDRVEQKLSRENGTQRGGGNTNGQTGQTSDDERQAQAVKRIQGGYRCALFSSSPRGSVQPARLPLSCRSLRTELADCACKDCSSHVKRREGAGCNIGSSKRWDDGMRKRELEAAGREQDQGQNDPGAPVQSCAGGFGRTELTKLPCVAERQPPVGSGARSLRPRSAKVSVL